MTIPNPSNLPEIAHVFAVDSGGKIIAGANASGVLFGTSLVLGTGAVSGGALSGTSLSIGSSGLGIASTGQATIQGLNGAGTAPTVAAGAGAGSGAAVSARKGHDLGGSFIVTTAGTPAAGALATVTFGTALAAAPAGVLVTCWDNTGAAGIDAGPTSVATTGFTVSTGTSATAAHALLITYVVIAS